MTDSELMLDDQRRALRRPLEQSTPAWLEAPALGPEPVRADLVDTSAGGVCLALAGPCALQPGDAVTIRSGAGPARGGQVRWREQTALIVAIGVAYDDKPADT